MAPREHLDPATLTRHAAGASPAEPYTFGALSADCKMGYPLVDRDFQVWAHPDCIIQKSGQGDWLFGATLGRGADGSLAQEAQTLQRRLRADEHRRLRADEHSESPAAQRKSGLPAHSLDRFPG